jgi:ribonuclease HI
MFNVIIDMDYWRNKDPVLPKDMLIWYTDGSRTDLGTGSGICGLKPNKSYNFSMGKFASFFQTEIYAILICAYKNIRRAYKNKRILIFSDSQAALKALSGPKVTSRLVEECLEALPALATFNEVTLLRVPGHHGILGNKMADKLARQASAMPLFVQSWLFKYLSVWQEKQLRAGLSINISVPGKSCQAADMASLL